MTSSEEEGLGPDKVRRENVIWQGVAREIKKTRHMSTRGMNKLLAYFNLVVMSIDDERRVYTVHLKSGLEFKGRHHDVNKQIFVCVDPDNNSTFEVPATDVAYLTD